MDVIGFLTSNATLVIVSLVVGVAVKYVPALAKIPNLVIPYLNALIVFLTAFNGPPMANAGILGDFAHQLSPIAKIVASLAVSGVAAAVYETFLRHPLEKLGVTKAT